RAEWQSYPFPIALGCRHAVSHRTPASVAMHDQTVAVVLCAGCRSQVDRNWAEAVRTHIAGVVEVSRPASANAWRVNHAGRQHRYDADIVGILLLAYRIQQRRACCLGRSVARTSGATIEHDLGGHVEKQPWARLAQCG